MNFGGAGVKLAEPVPATTDTAARVDAPPRRLPVGAYNGLWVGRRHLDLWVQHAAGHAGDVTLADTLAGIWVITPSDSREVDEVELGLAVDVD